MRIRFRSGAVALAGAAGIALLTSLAPATAMVAPPGPATTQHATGQHATIRHAAAGSSPCALTSSSETVQGPHLYDPTTKGTYPASSTVTVSQTTSLTNQEVKVCWTGFTPSKTNATNQVYNYLNTYYPVMAAECPGAAPASSPTALASCFGAAEQGQYEDNTQYGVTTAVYETTSAQGTGSLYIQLETGQQNQGLGCDSTRECSLVIVPVQGGNPGDPPQTKPDCDSHSHDTSPWFGGLPQGYFANADNTLATTPANEFTWDSCSWADRIVVPLHFAPLTACASITPAFTAEGSPSLQRAMGSWSTTLCHGRDPVNVSYNGSVAEPQARSDFLAGIPGADIALTTEPASGPGKHPYTYAPVAVTAASLAYWVDNQLTNTTYTNLKMNARLVLKLITGSYGLGWECWPNQKLSVTFGCNNAADFNPFDVFTDKEFRALNPGFPSKTSGAINTSGGYQFPTLLQGNSDITYDVTRWIAANPDATSFLAGQADPYGMHINENYRGEQFPEQAFNEQDPYQVWNSEFVPTLPLSQVATYQADNWDPGISWASTPGINPPQYPKDTPQEPGQRTLFAILDQADAAAFAMPAMLLQNHAGDYVGPTNASMAAAVDDMTASSSGTLDDSEDATNPKAYPWTMVVYAMVPTGGIAKAEATKIAQWLDFVAGQGQDQGLIPGQLPPGYLPLPSKLRTQTLKAAYDVLHQTGGKPGSHGGHPGGGTGPGSQPGGGSSPASKSSGPAKNSGGPGVSGHKVDAAYSSPFAGGLGRMLLPLLIAIGALLALAGPSAIVLSRPGARAALVTRWQRLVKSASHLGRNP